MKHRPREQPPSTPQEPGEAVFGLRAALGLFTRRRDDILRVAHAPDLRHDLHDLLRWATSKSVPVSEMANEKLARIASSDHHEGVCVIARPRAWTTPNALADMLVQKKGTALALDRVRNPYNVGAVLRSAAFFGVDGVILGALAPHPALAPDAIRVAEGGAEHVALTRTTDLADMLGRLQAKGVQVVGAEGTASLDVRGYAFKRPTVLVLGHEREGLSERVRTRCDALVSIRGTGAIESLNVGVAAGVFIAALVR